MVSELRRIQPASLVKWVSNTQVHTQQGPSVISPLLEKLATVTLGEHLSPNVLLEVKLLNHLDSQSIEILLNSRPDSRMIYIDEI